MTSYRSDPRVGGQGVYLYYLSKALVDAGHRVTVLSGDPLPLLDNRVRLIPLQGMNLYANGLHSLRIRHLGSYTNWVEWFSKLTGGFAEPWSFAKRASGWLRQHRDDYDIVHDNQCLATGMLDIQAAGIPLVTTIHHPITRDRLLAIRAADGIKNRLLVRRWYSFVAMQRQVAKALHHLVTVSECSRQDISQDFEIPAERLRVVHNGIDTDIFKPVPEIARDKYHLLSTASSEQSLKGGRFLLEAFSLLCREYKDLKLTVIGPLKPGGVTETLLKKLRIVRRVNFVQPQHHEIADYYARATLAVVPSLYEGFGLPAGEAMASGTPLVSTDGGALGEVVGDAAEVVKPGDARLLAAAISKLLETPARRMELSRQGTARITDYFTWPGAAEKMIDYYRQVIAQTSRSV